MKHTVSYWVDFSRLSNFFCCCLWKLKRHKNQKSTKVSVWVYWTYNRIYVLGIKSLNDQSCRGIEPTLLSSAEGLKQSASTTRPRRHFSNRNKGKYIEDHLTLLPLARKSSWMSSKISSIDWISTFQFRWSTKWLFTSNTGKL